MWSAGEGSMWVNLKRIVTSDCRSQMGQFFNGLSLKMMMIKNVGLHLEIS